MWVTYHGLVRQDVREIARYYDQIAPGLGLDFRNELEACITEIAKNPSRFGFIGEGLRRTNLKRFPYQVIYEFPGDYVRILVVRHRRRDPSFGIKRA